MRNAGWFVLVGLTLAACEPSVPNSAAGVGFGDYNNYQQQREAALQGAPVSSTALPPAGQSTAAYGNTAALDAAAAKTTQGTIGAEAIAALRATAPSTPGSAPVNPATGEYIGVNGQPRAPGVPMDAMSHYDGTKPAPVTDMTGSAAAGPNLAAYALSATNTLGQKVYERNGFKMTSTEKACAKYVSTDLAQRAFLEKGGPVKDPGNLDPDGDGFACAWDPRPFQAARQ
ncbi:hypothetical protein ACTTAI_06590 [Rhodobacter capsulatus]|uniref:hypothetical protein n=1 Tax=Rhodobacter capsulatus TaxID=1061 RepID=UPI004029D356